MKNRRQSDPNAPPAWAAAILRALVKPRDRDMVAGDLIEEYRETVRPERGALRARIWYCRQVLSFVRPDGLARLRSEMVPDCFLWAAVVAIAEYALLFLLPARTGAPVEALAVLLAAAVLAASAASGIHTIGDAWIVCRASALWLLLFGIVTALTVKAPEFTPIPLVVAFLAIVPMAGFQSARRTGVLRAGSAAGLAIGSVAFLAWTILAAKLRLPHPPFEAYPIPPAVAVILGTVGAIFGKRFGQASNT
jgi:hypothetical protein